MGHMGFQSLSQITSAGFLWKQMTFTKYSYNYHRLQHLLQHPGIVCNNRWWSNISSIIYRQKAKMKSYRMLSSSINKVFQNTQAPECMYVIWLFLIKKKVAQHLFVSTSWTLFCLFVGCLCFRKPEGEFPQKKKLNIRSLLLLPAKITLISPILLYLAAVGEERERKGYVNNGKG